MSILRSIARGALLAALLVSCYGCSSGSNEGKPSPAQALSLGGSNGYMLILHPNGKLYTIQLENGEAQAVWNMPELNKR